MQKVSLFILSFVLYLQAIANPLERNRWHDFEGMIGKKLAHFSIFVEDGGKLTGTMCYAGNQSSYLLRGTMIDNRLKFSLSLQKQIIAEVSGILTSSDADRIEGDWKEVSTGAKQKIKITYLASCGGDLTHRYTAIDFPDSVAEQFMQTAVTKIVAKDKQWVSENIFYPLNTTYLGKQGVTIRDAAELLANYDQIFYPAYLSSFTSLCFCGLFHNYRGVMLGSGELWIGQVPSTPGKKPRLVINAVNN